MTDKQIKKAVKQLHKYEHTPGYEEKALQLEKKLKEAGILDAEGAYHITLSKSVWETIATTM